MAKKLFTAQEMKDLMYTKNVMRRNHKTTVIGNTYQDGELFITYWINRNLSDITLTHEEITQVIQFDPSVKAFDDVMILDEDNVKYDYESYIDSCPNDLLIDFIYIARSIRAHKETNSLTQTKAA